MRLFMDALQPDAETRVLDVGAGDTGYMTEPGLGRTHNFFEAMYPWPGRIVAVSDVPLENFKRQFPTIECVVADGRDLPFDDDAFDIAFSNAVVEHVGGIEDQRRFVGELCRVAPRVFLSTPNRWFPVESHTLVPFLHWLPRGASDAAFGLLGKEIWHRTHLLSRGDVLGLFPGSVSTRVLESRLTITVAGWRD
jgi:SAM-dependent methyltransferase